MTKRKRESVPRASAAPSVDRIAALAELFPEIAGEGRLDLDKLRALLGAAADERPERYSFSWAGKRDAIRILAEQSRATLVPDRGQSVDFDPTGNVFIEGDNLEVLKLLYKSYFGRVKMIYIDPPYNTGNDFVYPDNYRDPLDTYLKLTGQRDADGNLLTSNTETSGRYHSTWLSMMYPRLFLARQLLRDDGVIFVSIDDHEVHNLRLVMNEIFGEETFIGCFLWKSRHNVDSRDKSGISSDHEYVLAYGKRLRGKGKDLDKYSNPDGDSRGPWMSDNLVGLATQEQRPNLHYGLVNPETGINYACPEKGWRYEKSSMAQKIQDGRILWPASPNGRPRHKKFLAELQSEFTGLSTFLSVPHTSAGTQELRDLFGTVVFDFPKPLELVRTLVEQGSFGEPCLILDFFAGSSPTAHAVLQLNRGDGGNRRFIMVQLPEPLPKPIQLDGGCELRTIADIGKERIRRVIARLKAEREGELPLPERATPEDLGFRVFRLAESNLRPWNGSSQSPGFSRKPERASASDPVPRLKPGPDYPPEGGTLTGTPEPPAEAPALFSDPLKDGWRPEDVITETALREGYSLSASIERVAGLPKKTTVWRVTDAERGQHFHICLDDRLTHAALAGLKLERTDLFVCRDLALDDETAANLALQCRLRVI